MQSLRDLGRVKSGPMTYARFSTMDRTIVGLGGGTGYLAIMTLVGISAATMTPTALLLNLVVTGTALLRFGLAGRLKWRLFLPFLLPAMPAAFLYSDEGQRIAAKHYYRPINPKIPTKLAKIKKLYTIDQQQYRVRVR